MDQLSKFLKIYIQLFQIYAGFLQHTTGSGSALSCCGQEVQLRDARNKADC